MVVLSGAALFLSDAASQTTFETRLVMFLAVSLLCVGIYAFAGQGFRSTLQVDPVRDQLRLGRVNRQNNFTMRQSFSVDDIESLFIARSKEGRSQARLYLRQKSTQESVLLLQAEESELRPLLERIVEHICKRNRNRNSRVCVTQEVFQVTFST